MLCVFYESGKSVYRKTGVGEGFALCSVYESGKCVCRQTWVGEGFALRSVISFICMRMMHLLSVAHCCMPTFSGCLSEACPAAVLSGAASMCMTSPDPQSCC